MVTAWPRCDHRPIAVPDPHSPLPSARRSRLRRRLRGEHDRGPLRRHSQDRVIGGVTAGVARRFGWDPTIVRIVFVLLGLGGGTGAGAYVVGWLALRRDDEEHSILQRAVRDGASVALAVGVATVLATLLSAFTVAGLSVAAGLVWPSALAGGGLVVVWRDGDEREREVFRRIASHLPGLDQLGVRTRRAAITRAALGLGALGIGFGAILLNGRSVGSAGDGAIAAVTILIAAAVVFGQLWIGLGRELAEERRERVRERERTDMAAHVHDSVLQTLALIQRQAEDPGQVVALARAQERELRRWLFEGRAPGSGADGATPLSAALATVESDVEALHGVAVDAVTVGDCELDDDVAALVDAGREAAVNAARWSGAPSVSLFAEVEPAQISLFVRDRGRGFNLAAIAPDRHGIAESIRGRMSRHGGAATIRSTPGEGTEVVLTMPRRESSP